MSGKGEKVMAKIGRQYVKLVTQKIMKVEEGQKKIRCEIAQLFGARLDELLSVDIDKAREFAYQICSLIDHYRQLDSYYRDVKAHLEDIVKKFGE